MNEVHENLVVWEIVNKCLGELIAYHQVPTESNKARPQDLVGYIDTVLRLKVLLDKHVIEKMQRELGFLFPASPPMRCMFERGDGGLCLRSGLPANDYFIFLGQ